MGFYFRGKIPAFFIKLRLISSTRSEMRFSNIHNEVLFVRSVLGSITPTESGRYWWELLQEPLKANPSVANYLSHSQ